MWFFKCCFHHTREQANSFYRPHPKDGEGNVFSLSTLGGGGQVRVQPGGGVRSESSRGGGSGQSSWGGGGSVQPAGGGGVSILRPLAGGMPLAFTQEDFLVISSLTNEQILYTRYEISNC